MGRYNQFNSPGVEVRFWEKVDRRGPEECWPWLGTRNRKGYGKLKVGDFGRRAHRVAWEFANDTTVPAGLHVLHHCDNPSCVNPRHLWLGTNDDNVRDRDAKGRLNPVRGEANGQAKLTNRQAFAILRRRSNGEREVDLAREFGVARTTVRRIFHGRSWAVLHERPDLASPLGPQVRNAVTPLRPSGFRSEQRAVQLDLFDGLASGRPEATPVRLASTAREAVAPIASPARAG